MDSIEKIGKSLDEAVNEALLALKTTKDQVEITVVEEGSRGFLGFLGKPYKVLVKRKYDPVYIATKFINEIVQAMNISVDVIIEPKERVLEITLIGSGASVLIGKHGQTLDSLQYLISLVVNKGEAPFLNVNLDCENYRQKRKETLENLAKNLAKKAKLTKKVVKLEPMSSYERRIIHSALQNDKGITTFSEGEDPYRNVVISPKIQQKYDKKVTKE